MPFEPAILGPSSLSRRPRAGHGLRRRGSPTQARSSSGGTGRLRKSPCATVQPRAVRRFQTASLSTPSATTSSPRFRPLASSAWPTSSIRAIPTEAPRTVCASGQALTPARVRLHLRKVGDRSRSDDREHLHVRHIALQERPGLARDDDQHADRSVRVQQGHADQRADADAPSPIGVGLASCSVSKHNAERPFARRARRGCPPPAAVREARRRRGRSPLPVTSSSPTSVETCAAVAPVSSRVRSTTSARTARRSCPSEAIRAAAQPPSATRCWSQVHRPRSLLGERDHGPRPFPAIDRAAAVSALSAHTDLSVGPIAGNERYAPNCRLSSRGGETPSRKVRTSQGRVVGNADPGKPAGKCHRKDTA